MYKAEIIGKEFVKGMLSVTVRFRDEEANDEVKEKFETSQTQPEEWLDEQVERKLKFMNDLQETAQGIEVNKTFEKKEEQIDEAKAAQTEFIDDFTKFRNMKRFIDLGIMEETEEYTALKETLKNNLKTEYIGLI